VVINENRLNEHIGLAAVVRKPPHAAFRMCINNHHHFSVSNPLTLCNALRILLCKQVKLKKVLVSLLAASFLSLTLREYLK
jgi:hypothetical protein